MERYKCYGRKTYALNAILYMHASNAKYTNLGGEKKEFAR
jgi:hypothetical protein